MGVKISRPWAFAILAVVLYVLIVLSGSSALNLAAQGGTFTPSPVVTTTQTWSFDYTWDFSISPFGFSEWPGVQNPGYCGIWSGTDWQGANGSTADCTEGAGWFWTHGSRIVSPTNAGAFSNVTDIYVEYNISGGAHYCLTDPNSPPHIYLLTLYNNLTPITEIGFDRNTGDCSTQSASALTYGSTDWYHYHADSPLTFDRLEILLISCYEYYAQTSDYCSNQAKILKLRMVGESQWLPTPTFAATVTPTVPTPVPTAGAGGGGGEGTYRHCAILGDDAARFNYWPGQWNSDEITAGSGNPPGSNTGLLMQPDSTATITLNLDQNAQYSIDVLYHITDTGGGASSFLVQLGNATARSIEVADSSAEQEATIPDQNYPPTSGDSIYDLAITEGSIDPDPGLIIDYICVTAQGATSDDPNDTAGGIVNVQCKTCTFVPGPDLIEDVVLLFQWLWCLLSQLWDCAAKTIFLGIWRVVTQIITFLALLRYWIGLAISNAAAWLVSIFYQVVGWLQGLIANIITFIINRLADILRGLGLADFLNTVLGFLNFSGGIGGVINYFLENIGNGINNLIAFLTQVWNTVLNALGLIPMLITSVISGFNSTSSIPAYAPQCSTPGTLLYIPCLGMYILDNTIFDGPFYFVFPIVCGFVALNAILWSVQAIKEAAIT